MAGLAAEVGVSPRLVSEFERGKRPQVSLATATRLLQQVGAPMPLASGPAAVDDAGERAERAARRRQTWSGSFSTLAKQAPPEVPSSPAERLIAVATASQMAVGPRTALLERSGITTPGRKR